LKYVDVIIDLLELHDLEHTLIGRVGAGLSVEQRKRVTIGVELVSKPSILIFLDEPTSGLDGQSAFNTVRFLRKLADVGQAVLVTIHQPSAQLFAEFDTLLLLAKGGKMVYFGDIGDNAQTVKDYFARYGVPCPANVNPAEHMIDVVSGHLSQGRDWNQVWLESPEHTSASRELDNIISEAASKPPGTVDDGYEFAMPLWDQTKIVTQRMSTSLYRNCDYIMNKIALHIGSALFNGFSFWMIGDGVADMQLKLFTIFNFIFVAPGVINQLQPLFIERRDIYDAREKKSKMYSWIAFVTALIVSEFPYLCICAVLYFVCWYYTVGFPTDSDKAGAMFFVMLCYEFLYTVCPPSPPPSASCQVSNMQPGNRPIHRRLRPQRHLRRAHQPPHPRYPRLLLRCSRSLRPDPGFLAVLDLLAQPLQLPHGQHAGLLRVRHRRQMQRWRVRCLRYTEWHDLCGLPVDVSAGVRVTRESRQS
jgi:energy-coupling factor transporter ATP-binding protein EcfA2